VDAENGQPIEGAILAYEWYTTEIGPPGLPGKDVTIEAGEEVSDAQGSVKIPRYPLVNRSLRMVIYKKGYVCWSNRHIFPSLEERKTFKLEDGMVIQLERFKKEYSEKAHARFTSYVSSGIPRGPRFGEALTKELELLFKK